MAHFQDLKIGKVVPVNPPDAKPIEPIFDGETAVLIATGPSLTDEQLNFVRASNAKVFTINNVYQRYPETDVHLSCDFPWWCHYFPTDVRLQELKAPRYTWHPVIAKEYGIDYIKGVDKPGLSTDRSVIHINHGSGPMAINLAAHYGISKLILIGHDMKFAPDYKPHQQDPGSVSRHYFDEYPKHLQHWPSVKVGKSAPGVLDGLIERYDQMTYQLENVFGMDVVNCTPGSALTTFRKGDLATELRTPGYWTHQDYEL